MPAALVHGLIGEDQAVRTLDPRLVSRTRAARPLLVADAAMGIATTVPVIVSATVLAGVVTRAFGRDPTARLGAAAAALVAAFAVRGALAWGMEVAGRRAAASVLSELRLDLARRRLRTQPLATDGVQSGEVVAASVQGIEALEAYFGRYLPQAVLATVVPVVVLGFVATVDLTSALIMLLTLPLVPVFMWLIGRYTEQRTREQWSALRTLSTHFLDVVRGLPTLRAFGRARRAAGDDRRGRGGATAARRWRRCGSRSCRARCWSSPRRSASRSSR